MVSSIWKVIGFVFSVRKEARLLFGVVKRCMVGVMMSVFSSGLSFSGGGLAVMLHIIRSFSSPFLMLVFGLVK